jgi:hypothetical protein
VNYIAGSTHLVVMGDARGERYKFELYISAELQADEAALHTSLRSVARTQAKRVGGEHGLTLIGYRERTDIRGTPSEWGPLRSLDPV